VHDVEKVLAYITRAGIGGPELLVFTQPAAPEGGVQVPGGTVDPGEPPDVAVLREVAEESGLSIGAIHGKLAEVLRDAPTHRELRHVYCMEAPEGCNDAWDHSVTGGGEDCDLVFSYRWLPLEQAAAELDWMGEWL
jgi:8-oxo-dGTP pyrophosphatase MutT (NUDIX family)